MITIKLEKIKPKFLEEFGETQNISSLINGYNNYAHCNDFHDLVCPCCKQKGTLKFHKEYSRNLSYLENNILIETSIDIVVVECTYCKKKHNKQKYHALLPFFVLPYHIYEASTLLGSVNDYLKNRKITKIIEKLQIQHKTFYDWIRKVNKYLLPASIVLKENIVMKTIVEKIYALNEKFLMEFYQNYYHPYFLFKQTCVSLCIIP